MDARGRRLRAALAAVLVPDDTAPELQLVREWLDSWAGLGLIIAGMAHQGWDVQLTAYAALHWRANFYPLGIAHSIVGGTAWERTPWAGGPEGGVGGVRRDSMNTIGLLGLVLVGEIASLGA